ncbi:hypothetical protein HK096_004089, partial [Nowakowskiella sp. JEL0078]
FIDAMLKRLGLEDDQPIEEEITVTHNKAIIDPATTLPTSSSKWIKLIIKNSEKVIPIYNDEPDWTLFHKFTATLNNFFKAAKFPDSTRLAFLHTKIGLEHCESLQAKMKECTEGKILLDYDRWLK